MQLAWSEGYCTFLQNMVRDWKGLSRPEIYVDTTGQPGTGQLLLGYQVVTPSFSVHGAGNEATVNDVLWDMFDRTTTLDANPGVDDDVMRITDARERFWDVFTQYLTLPFVLFGIFRYLYLVHQREEGGNPTQLLLNDRPLLLDVLLWVLTAAVVLVFSKTSTTRPQVAAGGA